MSRIKKNAAAAALAVCVVGSAEGVRQTAYPDPATHDPPWTACYGETKNIHFGDKFTMAQCDAMLIVRLDEFGDDVERCVHRPMSSKTEVAFISLAYNIGAGGFCKSTVVRLYNAGDGAGACDAMLRFNRAAGVVFPGLTRRREKERALCREGLKEAT